METVAIPEMERKSLHGGFPGNLSCRLIIYSRKSEAVAATAA